MTASNSQPRWYADRAVVTALIVVLVMVMSGAAAVGISEARKASAERRDQQIMAAFDAAKQMRFYQESVELQQVAIELLQSDRVIGPTGNILRLAKVTVGVTVRPDYTIVDSVTDEVMYDSRIDGDPRFLPLSEIGFGDGMFFIDPIDGDREPFRRVISSAWREIFDRLNQTCRSGDDVPWCWYPPD